MIIGKHTAMTGKVGMSKRLKTLETESEEIDSDTELKSEAEEDDELNEMEFSELEEAGRSTQLLSITETYCNAVIEKTIKQHKEMNQPKQGTSVTRLTGGTVFVLCSLGRTEADTLD
jgi:hypothetical protein